MPFDFKKEFKEFYLPPREPQIVSVPPVNYLAVRGQGDPNEEDGAYKRSIELLYGVAYTIKMSKKGDRRIEGYYDFVVPPLEGLWWQDENHLGKMGANTAESIPILDEKPVVPAGALAAFPGMDYARKGDLHFVSLIRLPDFVTPDDVAWAKSEASAKKKRPFDDVAFFTYDEGLCVQCMHLGPYDDEPATVERMHELVAREGLALDFSDTRLHHEIYLSDARKTAPEKLKTVLRHPVRPGRQEHPM